MYRIVCLLLAVHRSRSEMDITTAFEAVIGGSNPSESTECERAGNCLPA